jgi:hypothetical protein
MSKPKLQNCPVDDCGLPPDVTDMHGVVTIVCPKGHVRAQGEKMKDVAKIWNERRFNQKVP